MFEELLQSLQSSKKYRKRAIGVQKDKLAITEAKLVFILLYLKIKLRIGKVSYPLAVNLVDI